MEFVEHAIWLMKGRVGTCLCKYCMPGQNQQDINARLDREPAPNGDDDEGGGRGGGPGPHARRSRRAARRERTPPIMAKDYRVGNNSSGVA